MEEIRSALIGARETLKVTIVPIPHIQFIIPPCPSSNPSRVKHASWPYYISNGRSHEAQKSQLLSARQFPLSPRKSSTMQTSSFILSLVTAASAVTAQAQCNKIQIFTAVGHGETYPGVQRSITTAVCKGLSSCGVANIQYPSTSTGNGCKAIEEGIAYGRTAITEYVAKCPDAKIVVTGWSQGASVVGDLLAGGGGPGKGAMAGCMQATTPPMDPTTSPGSHSSYLTLLSFLPFPIQELD